MENRTRLGLAATSLAAAGTMIAPATASANDPPVIVCDVKYGCPGADPFIKIGDIFLKLEEFVAPDVFIKTEDVFIKLGDIFIKFEN